MFRQTYILALVVGALLLGARFAQAESVSVNSSGTIVAAMVASSPTALRFGNVAPSNVAGTVTITSGNVSSAAGGCTLVAGGTRGRAQVTITAGEPSRAVDITYPPNATLTSGANSMTVDSFVTVGSPATTTLNATGTRNFNVGGVLNVGANQPAGTYTGAMTITLSYQ